MNINGIIEAVNAAMDRYTYIGIRTQNSAAFELGRMTHNSRQFESRDLFGAQDVDNDADELNGVSAWALVTTSKLKRNAESIIEDCIDLYEHCAILGCDTMEYGMDFGEIVMQDADCILIIQ